MAVSVGRLQVPFAICSIAPVFDIAVRAFRVIRGLYLLGIQFSLCLSKHVREFSSLLQTSYPA